MMLITKIAKTLKWYRDRYFKYRYTKLTEQNITKNSGEKTIYLFCNPIHSNLGDQAQTMCILRWFATYFPDYKVICIPKQMSTPHTISDVKKRIKPTDLIFIHSGYLTTEMYGYLPFMSEIVRTFCDNKVTILPQTINIRTPQMQATVAEAFNSNPNLTLLCRDEISFESAKKLFKCRTLLYPDFVTSLIGNDEFSYKNSRSGVLFIIRDDKEKLYSDDEILALKDQLRNAGIKVDQIDTTIKTSPFKWIKGRENLIKKYLKIISKYQVVITDRYHGTIFSQVVSTPTIVIASNDHKLKSGVKWFPKAEFENMLYYANNLEEAYQMANYIISSKDKPECKSSYFEQKYWSKLHTIIS